MFISTKWKIHISQPKLWYFILTFRSHHEIFIRRSWYSVLPSLDASRLGRTKYQLLLMRSKRQNKVLKFWLWYMNFLLRIQMNEIYTSRQSEDGRPAVEALLLLSVWVLTVNFQSKMLHCLSVSESHTMTCDCHLLQPSAALYQPALSDTSTHIYTLSHHDSTTY